jgi:hypothetical protein
MDKETYIKYLKSRNFDDDFINRSVTVVLFLEKYIEKDNIKLKDITSEQIEKYVDYLIAHEMNTTSTLVALARYFYSINQQDIYLFFAYILGGAGVYSNIRERVRKLSGEKVSNNIFSDLKIPASGSSPRKYVPVTQELMRRMKSSLPKSEYKKALAGNNHQIPKESFDEEKEIFVKIGDIEKYLKNHHDRAVETLRKHCEEGKIWFEQVITPDVVEFVSKNQEILSGIRDGEYIYITKIPYQPDKFLKEKDDKKKRFLACHCPLAREGIINDGEPVDYEWCYCSAGFEKFLFDIIFDEETEVEVLESALKGNTRCRFSIKIPEKYLKK